MGLQVLALNDTAVCRILMGLQVLALNDTAVCRILMGLQVLALNHTAVCLILMGLQVLALNEASESRRWWARVQENCENVCQIVSSCTEHAC